MRRRPARGRAARRCGDPRCRGRVRARCYGRRGVTGPHQRLLQRRRGATVSQPTNQIEPSRTSTGNVFSDRAPLVALTAPASGLNAPWGPRTIAPVPTSYSAACHGHCRRPCSVTRPFPSGANRWRQRLETANGLPALMPTARAPCGVFSTTTTCEGPRSSTATSRAADCSKVLTRPISHTNDRGRPYGGPIAVESVRVARQDRSPTASFVAAPPGTLSALPPPDSQPGPSAVTAGHRLVAGLAQPFQWSLLVGVDDVIDGLSPSGVGALRAAALLRVSRGARLASGRSDGREPLAPHCDAGVTVM